MNNIRSILRSSFIALTMFLSAFTTEVVSAKTITNVSSGFIDTSRLDYFKGIYMTTDYDNYLLASEPTTVGYSTYTYYYFCLSNEDFTFNGAGDITLPCDELYRYYRTNNSDYYLERVNDNILSVKNSIYYSSNDYSKGLPIKAYLLGISIILSTFFICYFLFKIWRQ